ncbi:MAG: molybdenum cofactor biosynthesis protein MoaE [Gemmatimonadetes bacterium]|nr:molybdenum cofactor biosynthesis protein MoaE [Gemmatimonadota bacterium]MCC6770985.1 molybdenum cofactor biosynthesis protein MoaE [Gemmatimonadaceae bacterium]
MRVALVQAPIDVSAMLAEVSTASSGATTLFLGTVRDVNDARAVDGIEYSAYEAMARRELETIAREAEAQFGTPHIVVEHRIGFLALTDISIAIAVSHARRSPAMDAARYVIEEVKKRVPIWKREHYADGAREWVDPTRGHAEVRR